MGGGGEFENYNTHEEFNFQEKYLYHGVIYICMEGRGGGGGRGSS